MNKNKLTAEELGGVYNPELLLEGWTSASFLLMTVSLLFYHMTKAESIEMDPRIAGVFAVSIIILAVVLSVQALAVYIRRVGRLKQNKDRAPMHEEIVISHTYVAVAAILIVIETGIAYTILKGSFWPSRTSSLCARHRQRCHFYQCC